MVWCLLLFAHAEICVAKMLFINFKDMEKKKIISLLIMASLQAPREDLQSHFLFLCTVRTVVNLRGKSQKLIALIAAREFRPGNLSTESTIHS